MARRRRGRQQQQQDQDGPPAAPATDSDQQQQEAKEGSSPVDLTSIRLREDEEERREEEDARTEQEAQSPDLPTLLDQLEQSLSASASTPPRHPRRQGGAPSSQQETHDSDDDMQHEEARLPASAEKLRRALSESSARFYDASESDDSEEEEVEAGSDDDEMMEDAVEEGGEEAEQKRPPPMPSPPPLRAPVPPLPPSQGPTHSDGPPVSVSIDAPAPTLPPTQPSPLLPSAPGTTSSPASAAYWDCPGTAAAGGPTTDAGAEADIDIDGGAFATPLNGTAWTTAATTTGGGLQHSASAFSLDVRALTGSPVLRGAEKEEEATASWLPSPTPLSLPGGAGHGHGHGHHEDDGDDGDGSRDMHEVVCAAQRLSEAATQMRFAGLRGVGVGAGVGATSGSGSVVVHQQQPPPLCRHLAIFTLRPDVLATDVTAALVAAAQAQGLLISKRQGPHVVAEAPAASPSRCEWAAADMQLAVDRQTHDRVLLVRFLQAPPGASPPTTPRSSSASSAGPSTPSSSLSMAAANHSNHHHHSGGGNEAQSAKAAEEERRRRRPATKAFLEAVKGKLVEQGLNKHALARLAGCEGLRLDAQFLDQLEDMAREDMNRSLEAQARALEDYARGAEWRCSQLKGLLQPMFELYRVEAPMLGKPLPLSYYPLDLSGAYAEPGDEGAEGQWQEGQGQQRAKSGGEGTHARCPPGGGCLACVEGLKARAWDQLLRQCDAEMTARLQRKNRQVVDRLGRVSDYERFLLRTLRDNRHRMSIPLFKTFREETQQQQQQQGQQVGQQVGQPDDVETPLYYCRCIVGARPATLYVTYGHLVFISRLPGFGWHRRVAFRDVRQASLASLRLGFSKLAKAIEIELPKAAADQNSSSRRGGGGGGDNSNEALVFSSTTEPERLIELIKLLVSIHAAEEAGGDGDGDGGSSVVSGDGGSVGGRG